MKQFLNLFKIFAYNHSDKIWWRLGKYFSSYTEGMANLVKFKQPRGHNSRVIGTFWLVIILGPDILSKQTFTECLVKSR